MGGIWPASGWTRACCTGVGHAQEHVERLQAGISRMWIHALQISVDWDASVVHGDKGASKRVVVV